MYKAIHIQTGEEIVILHPRWLTQIQQLRELDRADRLVCQGCRQPLRVKAGPRKRPHFAHKHLQACSFGSVSPEILNARAVLYEWLVMQFGPAVTVEKVLEGTGLPRPVDCWVEGRSGSFAYWIIESGIRLEPREAILASFAKQGVKVHWVFLQSMLNEEKKEFHSLLLTPTERAFLQVTPFDEMLAGAGEVGQHYLDAETGVLTTFRGLELHHRPNWYKGLKKTTRLAEMLASPRDGEFLHPGELEKLAKFRQRQQRLENKRQAFQQREENLRQHLPDHPAASQPVDYHARRFAPGGLDAWGIEELPCAQCGQLTTNYWSTFYDENGRKLCRCRDCLE